MEQKPYVSRKTAGFVKQFNYYIFRCFVQQIRDLKALLLDIGYNILPGISMGVVGLSQEMYIPPIPTSIVPTCIDVISDRCQLESLTRSGLSTVMFFTTMVAGASAAVVATRTFGESQEKLNFYRESSAGTNTLSYFLAKNVFDLWNIFR